MVSFTQYENLGNTAEGCQLLGNILFLKLCYPRKECEIPRVFIHRNVLSLQSETRVGLLLTCLVI